MGKNCNGPDYKIDLIGPFSAKSLSSSSLSVETMHVSPKAGNTFDAKKSFPVNYAGM